MAREFAKRFYKSKEWQKCRELKILSVNGLCERCKAKGIIKKGKILHHIKYITPENINDPEITLNHSNLEYVCLPCHNTIHFGSNSSVRDDVYFDENGDLIGF